MRTDKENIRAYLLTQIGRGEKKYASKTVEAFGIAKATVYTYVKELEAEGIIRKTGNREYALTETRYSFRYQTADHPDESRLLRRDIAPLMRSLPQNVTDIWDYAVSEMLNNAIDHADAENIRLTVTMDALNTTVSISDDGVGIFRHIHDYVLRETGEDLLPDECASLLLAGKFTTARDRHSGEGIFFTSHMMDRFVIVSGGTRFERDNFEDVQSWMPDLGGTGVFMQLSNTTKKTVREIFNRFSSVDEGFYRTQIPMLHMFPSGFPVSRSEARRLGSLIGQFREATLDFTGVRELGQAFAHELFIVWKKDHPDFILNIENASDDVLSMIRRVENTK
ncbi:MAG: ATP-binding protein [Clostridia bacterium]|nr:ATP-binding protein [Clostridia bacterium]